MQGPGGGDGSRMLIRGPLCYPSPQLPSLSLDLARACPAARRSSRNGVEAHGKALRTRRGDCASWGSTPSRYGDGGSSLPRPGVPLPPGFPQPGQSGLAAAAAPRGP